MRQEMEKIKRIARTKPGLFFIKKDLKGNKYTLFL